MRSRRMYSAWLHSLDPHFSRSASASDLVALDAPEQSNTRRWPDRWDLALELRVTATCLALWLIVARRHRRHLFYGKHAAGDKVR